MNVVCVCVNYQKGSVTLCTVYPLAKGRKACHCVASPIVFVHFLFLARVFIIILLQAKKRTKFMPAKLTESPKSMDVEAAEPLIKAQQGNGGTPMAAGGLLQQSSQGGVHPTSRTLRGSTPGHSSHGSS